MDGGVAHLGDEGDRAWVIATKPDCVLWAYYDEHLVFRYHFKAIPPPPPLLTCQLVFSALADQTPAIAERCIQFRATPNQQFANEYPEDARYRVSRAQIRLVRNGQVADKAYAFPSARHGISMSRIPLSQLPWPLRSTDKLLVTITETQRKNARDAIETLAVHQTFTLIVP